MSRWSTGPLRHEPIVLSRIVGFCQELKVCLDVQSTHDRGLQRDDVIDFPSDASLGGHSQGRVIESSDGAEIGPRWRRFQSQGRTFCDGRRDLAFVGACPRSVRSRQRFTMTGIVGLTVGLLSLVMGLSVALFCLAQLVWMGLTICAIDRTYVSRAFLTLRFGLRSDVFSVGGAPRRTSSFDLIALCASIGRLLRACLLRMRGFEGFASRTLLVAVLRAPFRLSEKVARLTFVIGHFASMWASMMRRTNSAIEMPSRFASRFRNARCGSVNEIICLVIGLQGKQHTRDDLSVFSRDFDESSRRSVLGSPAFSVRAILFFKPSVASHSPQVVISGFRDAQENLKHIARRVMKSLLGSLIHGLSIPQGIPCL